MNITIDNYFGLLKSSNEFLDVLNANSSFLAANDFLVQVTQGGKDVSPYHKSEKIKETIDLFFQKLEAEAAKKKARPATAKSSRKKDKATQEGKREAAPKKAKASKTTKSNSNTPKNATMVEHIPSDIALIKKYIGLHNKRKTYEQVLSIWRAFEKAIVERKVTKDSPYKSTIEHLQVNLKKALEAAEATGALELSIAPKALEEYKAIAESVEKSPSVPLLLELINISGKSRQEERAAN